MKASSINTLNNQKKSLISSFIQSEKIIEFSFLVLFPRFLLKKQKQKVDFQKTNETKKSY